MFYTQSGSWKPDCPPSPTQPPYCSESWNPADEGLPTWRPNLEDVYEERRAQHRFYSANPSAEGYFNWHWHNAPAYGYGVWFSNRECKLYDEQGNVMKPSSLKAYLTMFQGDQGEL